MTLESNGALRLGSAAVIGSYRQNFSALQETRAAFQRAGWHVTTPTGGIALNPGAEFVVTSTDPDGLAYHLIEAIAMHRILRADMVYTHAPGGYVGKTTCYEIGRVLQAGRPLYFSEEPRDLPIAVPETAIVPASDLISWLQSHKPEPIIASLEGQEEVLEKRLVSGDYIPD